MPEPLRLWLVANAEPLSLGLQALLLIGVLWVGWRLAGQQRRHDQTEQALAALLQQQSDLVVDEVRDTADFVRRDLSGQLGGNQALTQEAVHRAQSILLEDSSERLNRLQRELLADAGGLKTDLLGRFEHLQKDILAALADGRLAQQRELAELRSSTVEQLNHHREHSEQRQSEAFQKQQASLAAAMQSMSTQVGEAFRLSSDELGKRVQGLTETTSTRLQEISGQVERRLSEGFEKSTETFTRVLEHLTRIDEAQKKITELSTSVVSLQEVLTDKRSRGAFGEVQLAGLVRNVMPEGSFELQKTLSNGTRVDCLLRLPEPTGDVPIDAKFPLESFQRMMDPDLAELERAQAARQFRLDIKKHINDIADKYLVPDETADGAMMFLPAEAIFAEIHARFPDLVEHAQGRRVWLVSPTTLMAMLTTARAVLKDDATRKQVHVIQDHLRRLSEDFGRFQSRMDNLAQHIRQANDDVKRVHTSARKIHARFGQIDAVEVELPEPPVEGRVAGEIEGSGS